MSKKIKVVLKENISEEQFCYHTFGKTNINGHLNMFDVDKMKNRKIDAEMLENGDLKVRIIHKDSTIVATKYTHIDKGIWNIA